MAHLTTWESSGIEVRYRDEVSDREIAQLVREFQADARFDTVRYIVHDFRQCTGLSYAPTVIEELSATDSAAALSKPRHRVAVVSDRPDVLAMVQAYLDTGLHPRDKLRVFTDIDAARAWLGA